VNVTQVFRGVLPKADDMSEDRKRVTTRLRPEVYEQLCDELSTFDSDTARLQFLVQFYLDYKELGHPQPPAQTICKGTSYTCDEEDETKDDNS
jgi:hypothetical protein